MTISPKRMTASAPLLSAAEEVELGKAIEAGLYAEHLLREGRWSIEATPEDLRAVAREGREAFDRFVVGNICLAVAWTTGIQPAAAACGVDSEDLVTEAILGVVRAVQKWDYTLGLKFSTYATGWIRNFLQKAMNRAPVVHIAQTRVERSRWLQHRREDLIALIGHVPTDRELASFLDLPVEEVVALDHLARPALSLDAPVRTPSGGYCTLGGLVAETRASFEGPDIGHLLACLDPEERELIEELYGLTDGVDRTAAALARKLGVSEQSLTRVARRARAKMREAARDFTAA